MQANQDVIIIGGGIIGLACAHYLADRNVQVHILERAEIGAGASSGNCGLLHFSGVIPLCAPGTVRHELQRALAGSSPLRIKPGFDLRLLNWLWQFARHCNRPHQQRGSAAKDQLMTESCRLFAELLDQSALDCDFARKGLLLLFTDPTGFDGYRATNEILEEYDFAARPLSGQATRELEPAVSEQVVGSWYNPHDWHLRPDFLLDSWRKLLQERGVAIEENCAVTGFSHDRGRIQKATTSRGNFPAENFILAAGAWSGQLARQLSLRIPVQPGKGYSMTFGVPTPAPQIPCLMKEASMVATPWKSGYRLGGTMEFSGLNEELDETRLARLKPGAADYLICDQTVEPEQRWAGLRPMCYDDLPIIGRPASWTNLHLATGHGMLGLSMATATGLALAESLCEGRSSIDLQPFSPDRFA